MQDMPEGGAMLIEAEELGVSYAGTPALKGVTLGIERGEIVTVVGPNGSGKSTLIRALLGILPASTGRVTRNPGLRIGYVPQSLAIDRSLPITVEGFLNLPVRHPATEAKAMLSRVGVTGLQKRQMTELSGGQFQRVLLARALLGSPDILILDEPTQGLDQPGVAAFYRLVEEIRREMRCAILLVSHDLHVVMSATDRVICLNGHVCCEGAPDAVLAAPEYRALFGDGTGGALALYQHHHDHDHDHVHAGGHQHGPDQDAKVH